MAKELELTLLAAKLRLWVVYNELPNPSTDSMDMLHRIRSVEKTLKALQATMDRQGW